MVGLDGPLELVCLGGPVLRTEHTSQHRRLRAFESCSEDFMTGGWVRVLATAEQVRKERPGMERAAKAGLVRIHGTHRGVLLVEFWTFPGAEQPPQGSAAIC